jgi:hypothetical protein
MPQAQKAVAAGAVVLSSKSVPMTVAELCASGAPYMDGLQAALNNYLQLSDSQTSADIVVRSVHQYLHGESYSACQMR